MIAMVCMSVVATVVIIHIGFKATKMPRWVRVLFIDCLGKCVGIKHAKGIRSSNNKCYVNEAMMTSQSRDQPNNLENDMNHATNGHLNLDILNKRDGIGNHGNGDNPQNFMIGSKANNSQMLEITQSLATISNDFEQKSNANELLAQWRLVSMIIDRLLMLIFTTFSVVVTLVMTTYVLVESDRDFTALTTDPENEL